MRRGGKESAFYLNGSPIPWKKVWKEIRRSGAHLIDQDMSCHSLCESPPNCPWANLTLKPDSLSMGALPAGVTIQTPPSTPPPTRSPSIALSGQSGLEDKSHSSLIPVNAGHRTSLLSAAKGFNELHILNNSASMGHSPGHTTTGIDIGLDETSTSQSQDQDHVSKLNKSHSLVRIMYILSSNLLDGADEEEILHVVFTQTPKSVLL